MDKYRISVIPWLWILGAVYCIYVDDKISFAFCIVMGRLEFMMHDIQCIKRKLKVKSVSRLEPPDLDSEDACPICRDPACTSDHK